MSWKITYKDKWSGETRVHTNTNNQSDAEGWTKNLAQDNNCKATCEHIADGPYDRSGKRTHVISIGSDE